MGSRTMTALSLDREKSPVGGSSFFGSILGHGKAESSQNYVAEPWVPPPSSSPVPNGGGQAIMVQPWNPTEASEQAFLSPTGTAAELPYQPQQTPSPSVTSASPRPPMYGAPPVSPGVNQQQQQQYHQQSISGHSQQRPMSQVSWVSATSQPPPSSAISGTFTPPPPPQGSGSIMQVHPPGTYVPTGPGAVRPLPTVPGSTRNSGVM